jgi:hypothetical protein
MDYQGPTKDDLENIAALNRSFLGAVSDSRDAAFTVFATYKIDGAERRRLADAPFLLFSFREQESEYWQHLLDDDPQIDLIDAGDRPDKAVQALQTAGIGFLWQLARRNPYAVRLACGATLDWCERLAELTLVALLHRTAQRGDLLQLRFADNNDVWRRLLGTGSAASPSARRSSHHFALQVMLTRRNAQHRNRQSAAACAMRGAGRGVTHRSAAGIRVPKV